MAGRTNFGDLLPAFSCSGGLRRRKYGRGAAWQLGSSRMSRIWQMNGYWRLGALLALMSIVAWIDWRRHSAAATKWREYSFLLAAGLLGGLIGIANDLITSAISPDYFIFGKGIPADDHFRLHVASLGFQAGLLMGMLVGGIYLIANNPKPDRHSLSPAQLFGFALSPVLSAMLIAPVVAILIFRWDPLHFTAKLGDVLTPMQTSRFLAVWGIHLGIYAGGLLGTAYAVCAIRRRRGLKALSVRLEE
jgi:hypothetical protein